MSYLNDHEEPFITPDNGRDAYVATNRDVGVSPTKGVDDFHGNDNQFSVQIPGFTKYFRDASEEQLWGHGKLERKLEIKIGDTSIFINEMEINLFSRSVDECPDADEYHDAISVEIEEGVAYATINLSMPSPSDQFSALRDNPQQLEQLSTIELSFWIQDDRSFEENESSFFCEVTEFDFSFSEYRLASLPLNYDEIRKILKPWVPGGTDSQTGRIGTELVKSLYAWLEQNPKVQIRNGFYDHNSTYEYDEYLRTIGNLIDELRESRYDGMSATQLEYMNAMKLEYWEYAGNSRESFLKKTEGLSNTEKRELINRYNSYDQIWSGYRPSIIEFIKTGKMIKTEWQTSLDYQCLRNSELEEVARIYTINTWMQSPSLEWLLVDALLFNEAVQFACEVNNMPDKIPIPKLIWAVNHGLTLLFEGFALALTAFISDLIDGTHSTAYWVVFATITLGRWLNPYYPFNAQKEAEKKTLKEYLKKHEQRKQLSSDMIKANDRSKEIDVFNARLVREMLYDLEKRGAVYSQAVFNVLDKRIARE